VLRRIRCPNSYPIRASRPSSFSFQAAQPSEALWTWGRAGLIKLIQLRDRRHSAACRPAGITSIALGGRANRSYSGSGLAFGRNRFERFAWQRSDPRLLWSPFARWPQSSRAPPLLKPIVHGALSTSTPTAVPQTAASPRTSSAWRRRVVPVPGACKIHGIWPMAREAKRLVVPPGADAAVDKQNS
jgi:hypothetical protein